MNTTAAPLAVPALSATYTKALSLNGNSTYTNGSATWTGSVPVTLAAQSAIVVSQ